MSIKAVKSYFESVGMGERVMELESSSATVEEAAGAIGCEPKQIAKTMSFLQGEKPVLIVTAGDVKVDNKKYKALFHQKARMIPGGQVEAYIGHAPGGVCPFAVKPEVTVYLDVSLKRFEKVYPAAGSGNSAVELSLAELEQHSHFLQWVDVCSGGIEKRDRIAGGFYGLLIGDALGVPYEFYKAERLPSYEEIDMVPPAGFKKTYPQVEAGTWSDDGAQALCLLDSLLGRKKFDLDSFSDLILDWYENGLWAVGNKVFDVGIQTSQALHAYKGGMPAQKCGLLNPEGKGNGALMRALPLALWQEDRKQLVLDAHRQCLITHGHVCNQVCCALYCLVAGNLLEGRRAGEAIEEAVAKLREIYRDMLPEYGQELEWSIRPGASWEGTGTGYVVDCLRSAFMVLEQTSSYEEAVKRAILLGNDTDTTACVAGGLAGILYGLPGIPKRWLSMLREREKAEELLERLLLEKGIGA